MGSYFTCEDKNPSTKNLVVLCYPNGEKYIGESRFGMRNGFGTYFFSNGDRYEGTWLNNMRHGKGTLYDNDGSLYIGEWRNNQREGEGQYFMLNGGRYIGLWKNNKKHGEGTIISSNGTTFQGNFVNDKKHGKGVHITKNHKYFEEWKDGKMVERICEGGDESPEGESSIKKVDKSPTTPLLNSLESNSNRQAQTSDKNADMLSKSPSLNNMNLYRSDNVHSLAVSDNKTEVNVGQETLSIIDYIDANFPVLKKNVFEWDTGDVIEWLKHIGLEEYCEICRVNHITGKNLFEIKEEELKSEFNMVSVGHRKNFLNSVDYLRRIYMENRGRRLSMIRAKLAQLYYKKHPVNWGSKKVKSVCDVIEEEDDNIENNLKSLPEEHEINAKYKALRKEGFLNSPLGVITKKSSVKSEPDVEEEEKKEIPEIRKFNQANEPKSPLLIRKNSKSNNTLQKNPSQLQEENKNEIQEDRLKNELIESLSFDL